MKWTSSMIHDPMALNALAAILFSLWPYFLDKAGLKGFESPTAFVIMQAVSFLTFSLCRDIYADNPRMAIITGVVIVVLIGFAYLKWGTLEVRWEFVMIACIMSSTGLICFTRMLRLISTAGEIQSLYMCGQVMLQVIVSSSIYLTFNPKDVTVVKILGIGQALSAIIMMFMKGK